MRMVVLDCRRGLVVTQVGLVRISQPSGHPQRTGSNRSSGGPDMHAGASSRP